MINVPFQDDDDGRARKKAREEEKSEEAQIISKCIRCQRQKFPDVQPDNAAVRNVGEAREFLLHPFKL